MGKRSLSCPGHKADLQLSPESADLSVHSFRYCIKILKHPLYAQTTCHLTKSTRLILEKGKLRVPQGHMISKTQRRDLHRAPDALWGGYNPRPNHKRLGPRMGTNSLDPEVLLAEW